MKTETVCAVTWQADAAGEVVHGAPNPAAKVVGTSVVVHEEGIFTYVFWAWEEESIECESPS